MFVRDLMTPRPATVRAETSAKEALRLLDRRGVTLLPVVSANGMLRGVVSEDDLIRESINLDPRTQLRPPESQHDSGPRTVAEVMSGHPVTVREQTDLADAVGLMTSTSVKSLPVVDERGRIVGMISRSDVVHALARADDTLEREVDAVLVALGHTDWLVEVNDGHVIVSGPDNPRDGSLARLAANTVSGVTGVRVN